MSAAASITGGSGDSGARVSGLWVDRSAVVTATPGPPRMVRVGRRPGRPVSGVAAGVPS
jgi:hypothetical protein